MTQNSEIPSPVPPAHPKLAELEGKLSQLEASLLANDPKMPTHLREVHAYLIQFEELSHLLKEEQIAVILDGQQRKVGIILAEETTKAKKTTKIKGGIGADDL